MRNFLRDLLAPGKIRQTKLYLLISACGLVLLSLGVHEILGQNGYLARRRRRIQIQALAGEIEKLKQDNLELAQKIKNLRSDPNTIERLAREQLSLGRPGDVVVNLPPAEQSAASSSPTSPAK
jgi:cell division protein FtsB